MSDARTTTVGFLHPGMMGASLGAACIGDAIWASDGRSVETRRRAEAAVIRDVGSLDALVVEAEIIVSICPPGSAEALAETVAAAVARRGFDGVYLDANAISPTLSRSIGERFARYVDGSVIGPPAGRAGTTRLYLAGDEAPGVATLFEGSPLDARVLDGEIGAASALKMAYASWTKIGGSMLLAIRALAEQEGVADALVEEWGISQPGLDERSNRTAGGVGPKAWRFIGEMEQIGATFAAADLPTGFADAASEIYERMQDLKGSEAPSLDEVLGLINE